MTYNRSIPLQVDVSLMLDDLNQVIHNLFHFKPAVQGNFRV